MNDVNYLVAIIPAFNRFIGSQTEHSVDVQFDGDLILAGDAGVKLFDTSVESRHDDDAQRALASVLYFREHAIKDENMRTYVIPVRANTKSNLFELLRGRCMEWQYSFQGEIIKFYLKGVRQTCDEMGGLEFFESTSTEQRRKMWSAIFDQYKSAMASASLGQVASTIPIDHIFSARHPLNLKWQSYIKNTFVWAAEDTYLYRYAQSDKVTCYARWVAMPLAPAFQSLNLGSLQQTPVKIGGIYSQGKRANTQKITYGAEHSLEVCQSVQMFVSLLTCPRRCRILFGWKWP